MRNARRCGKRGDARPRPVESSGGVTYLEGMSLIAKVLGNVLEKTLMHSAKVTAVSKLGRFRLIELQGEGFKNLKWSPGDKLRVKLGDLVLRTYTPLSWDPGRGTTRILSWLPGRGPGTAWAAQTRKGDVFPFKGPKESLDLSQAATGPVVFFGDETSLGAAAALRALRPGDGSVKFVFELDDPADAAAALAAVGLEDAVAVARPRVGGHLVAARDAIVAIAQEWNGEGRVFLVGNQASVKELRGMLGAALGKNVNYTVKVYWREGKAGLD